MWRAEFMLQRMDLILKAIDVVIGEAHPREAIEMLDLIGDELTAMEKQIAAIKESLMRFPNMPPPKL